MNEDKLIIQLEDEFSIQSIFKTIAKKHGYNNIIQYNDATEANIDNKYNNAKVIVSDYNMPGGDAIYMLSFLKEHDINTPVILLSGLSSNFDIIKEKSLDKNIIAFEEKPESMNKIFKIIDNL